MKNNKSEDRSRWESEWLKEGEDDMIESLTTIFNRVEEEGQIPLQWRETSIKSLYKGGGSKEKIQESQRGIFIINIVSKAYMKLQRRSRTRQYKATCPICRLQERRTDQQSITSL